MNQLPNKLYKKLQQREENNSLRELKTSKSLVDFSSNDYLGFAKDIFIYEKVDVLLRKKAMLQNGATGSRLLSGNHEMYSELEKFLRDFHQVESALIFNSGYDANLGFFSSVPQRGDIIFYDELIHASIRDGIQMGLATSYKFAHNNISDLEKKYDNIQSKIKDQDHIEIYIVTESVFSMDGDIPELKKLSEFCQKKSCRLIVDEAHATGVFGDHGCGFVQQLGLEKEVFARIHTFGKALGCHGAAILGSNDLITYLVNFARSFIYTTGLSPHSLATALTAYEELKTSAQIQKLSDIICFFNNKIKELKLEPLFISSSSAIQSCIISGNDNVKKIAHTIQTNGFDIKPILSPTVPQGKERLRFCLHAFNKPQEISEVLELLATFVR